MKYWEKLLYEWRKMGKEGFTIPFIIGSQKYLLNNHKIQDVKELINDIALSKEFKIYLKYCLTTEDLILGILEKSKTRYILDNIRFRNNEDSNLYVFRFNNDIGSDIETLSENLLSDYSNYIKLEKFSKTERDRGDFEPSEIVFIKNCFQDLQ